MIDNKDGTVTASYTEFVEHLLKTDKAVGSSDCIDTLVRAAIDGGYRC